ncbi:MAG: TRAP transporter substrate-binding protein DctP [Phycisphaeraceae bacterium]
MKNRNQIHAGRRGVEWITAGVAAVACAIALGMATPAAADTRVIKYADGDPSTCVRCEFLQENYFPAIEEATNGGISVQPFFGAVLGGHPENITLVEDGVVEFSEAWVGYHPTVLVAQSVFDLFPRGPAEYENQIYFYRRAYERIPAFRAELEKRDLKLMMVMPLLHLGFASSEPVKALDDIKGQKVRAGSKWLLQYLENAGASPVSVPWDDVYVSLQTGVIDGVLTNYDGINNMKFYEPAPHLLIAADVWMANPIIYFVNKSFFEELPQEVQDGWIQASEEAQQAYGEVLAAEREKIIEHQKAVGVTVTEMSAADVSSWENADKLVEARARWVEEAEAAGLDDAQAVMDMATEIHAEALAREAD